MRGLVDTTPPKITKIEALGRAWEIDSNSVIALPVFVGETTTVNVSASSDISGIESIHWIAPESKIAKRTPWPQGKNTQVMDISYNSKLWKKGNRVADLSLAVSNEAGLTSSQVSLKIIKILPTLSGPRSVKYWKAAKNSSKVKELIELTGMYFAPSIVDKPYWNEDDWAHVATWLNFLDGRVPQAIRDNMMQGNQ